MPEIALALPIPAEKVQTWRETVESFTGERRAEFDAARRRQRVVRERAWIQETPEGLMEILVIETEDPEAMFQQMATSQDPFDVEFREFLLDVYGVDLTKPLPGPRPELVVDWSATRTTAHQ
jgi:hypothetical protein